MALSANRFVRRTVAMEGPDGTRGGVRGSFPVDGSYGSMEYLNWATKFFIDANQIELDVSSGRAVERTPAAAAETAPVN